MLDLGKDELEEAKANFRSLIRIDTSNPPGNEKEAVELLSGIFAKRGIEYSIHEPVPGRASIVARIPGNGEAPILLLSHLDVVPADASLWKHPPFSADEAEGSIWGRGTLDTKQLTAMQLAAFLHLHDLGRKPNREVIFAATADEETGSRLGMEHLSRNRFSTMTGSLCISEGGGFPIRFCDRAFILCTAGEKGICRVRLSTGGAKGPEGLGILADGLRRLLAWDFGSNLEGTARGFLDRLGISADFSGDVDDGLRGLHRYMLHDSVFVDSLRYVATIDEYPAAELEFRTDPSMTESAARAALASLLRGSSAVFEISAFEQGFESDLDSPLLRSLEKNCKHYGLDAMLLPIFALGKTDGRYLGRDHSSVYGFSPVLLDDDFPKVLKRVHGIDERISLDSFFFGCKVISRSIMELSIPISTTRGIP